MTVVNLHANIDQSYYRMMAADGELALVENFTAKRPSVEERAAAGKALREKVPRSAHAEFERGSERPDPVAILEKQNETRVARLVPVRYARMLASPFAFLRGSAAATTDDLATTPTTGMQAACCGDMHVSNFGVYASAERSLVFSINDFDEVHPGPWEWDLKRLAASATVAISFMGGDKAQSEEAAQEIVGSYRSRSAATPRWPPAGVVRLDRRGGGARRAVAQAQATPNRPGEVRRKNHVETLDKLTERVNGEHRIIEDVPLIVRERLSDAGLPVDVTLDRMLHAYLESRRVRGARSCCRAIASSTWRARW